jgi:hypothetical protein
MADAATKFDQYHQVIIRELDKQLEVTEDLRKKVEGSRQDCALIVAELKRLKDDIAALTKLIREGNGKNCILGRIGALEQSVSQVEVWMANQKQRIEARRTEMIRGKWQLIATLAASLLALTGSVVAILLK